MHIYVYFIWVINTPAGVAVSLLWLDSKKGGKVIITQGAHLSRSTQK